jgi:hypothetical protein
MGGWHGNREGRGIPSDRREGALVGYELQAIKPGVGDRVDGYLEPTARRKFYLAVAYPPSMRLGRLFQCSVTWKVAMESFEAFAEVALRTIDVSRTETKNWS